jgi:PAS domain S-box-containing protein
MSSREFLGFSVSEWLGMGAASGSLVLLFWRRVGSHIVEAVTNALSAPRRINEVMEIVKHELTPNSGGSLKDQVMKSNAVLANLSTEFQATTRSVAGLRVCTQLLLSELAVPVWESDDKGSCLWINETFTRVTGWSLPDIQGENWRANVVHQDDRSIVEREWDHAIKGGRNFRCTYRWRTKDGRTLLVEGSSRPITTDKGLVTGHMGRVRILEST